ncbi:MAG: hypothetical protein KDC71_15165 [Acidobacteria bacterium]|nr:hypothetical protein [Acidobacteriota bacterium]
MFRITCILFLSSLLLGQNHFAHVDITQGSKIGASVAFYFLDNGTAHDVYQYIKGQNDSQYLLIGKVESGGKAFFYNGANDPAFWSAFVQRNQLAARFHFFGVKTKDNLEELQLDVAGSTPYSIRTQHVIDDYCGTNRPPWPLPVGITVTPEPPCWECGDPDPQPNTHFLGMAALAPVDGLDAFVIGAFQIGLDQSALQMTLPHVGVGKGLDGQALERVFLAQIPAEN